MKIQRKLGGGGRVRGAGSGGGGCENLKKWGVQGGGFRVRGVSGWM